MKEDLLCNPVLNSDLGLLDLVEDGLNLLDLGIPSNGSDGFPPHL